jgi:hypothetical protein
MLRFSDGISIDTSGEPRVLRLNDGYYAVGKGLLIPADNLQSAEFLVQRMHKWEPSQNIINSRVEVLNLQNK